MMPSVSLMLQHPAFSFFKASFFPATILSRLKVPLGSSALVFVLDFQFNTVKGLFN
jgi:hypothetical protein